MGLSTLPQDGTNDQRQVATVVRNLVDGKSIRRERSRSPLRRRRPTSATSVSVATASYC